LPQPVAQARENRLPIGRVLGGLVFVVADDVAAIFDPDFLDPQRRRVLAGLPRAVDFVVAARAAEDLLVDFLDRAEPSAKSG
jgi:hypothetical protein